MAKYVCCRRLFAAVRLKCSDGKLILQTEESGMFSGGRVLFFIFSKASCRRLERHQLRSAGELHVRSLLSQKGCSGARLYPLVTALARGHDAWHLRIASRIHAGLAHTVTPLAHSFAAPEQECLEGRRVDPSPPSMEAKRSDFGHGGHGMPWLWLEGLHHLLGCILFSG